MMSRKGVWNSIAFLILLLLVIAFIVARNRTQRELKSKGIVVNTTITTAVTGGRTEGGFRCAFNYKGERIELFTPSSVKRGRFNLVGKTFPAMYLPNTSTIEILIKPQDFEKFNIPYPDSLKRFLDY
ncbi:hypothetical protein [Niabella soli]|uniref:DUF3592 domain-containing protein n=1 Tax=Niabella soli DSM 19437 TaxID=929713 RepID=W0F5Y1_9BACT|nr:hypothetical protein [Niabella soli]AHF17213.1 hypothetical protein NIASO_03810 [Niabella soli DSM 19437]